MSPSVSAKPSPSMNSCEEPLRLAYLVSEYPGVSHTFILREVRQLRARNFDIRVASINFPYQPATQMAVEDREEAATTFYLKKAGIGGGVRAHLRAVAHRPVAYLRGLMFALVLGGTDFRQLLYALFYFTEAL